MKNPSHIFASLALSLFLAFPGHVQGSDQADKDYGHDPLEGFNRGVMEFNFFIDDGFLRPLSMFYRDLTTPKIRKGVKNFWSNLQEPIIFANDVLQGEIEDAGNTLGRFAINSTIGVLGVMDQANDLGLPPHGNDFGKTLYVYGIGDGPPIALPFFGIFSLRDAVGLGVDKAAESYHPVTYIDNGATILTASNIKIFDDRLAAFAIIRRIRSAPDPYVLARTLQLQNQRARLTEPGEVDVDNLPDVELN